jgi:glutamate synthase domain-containing protein 2
MRGSFTLRTLFFFLFGVLFLSLGAATYFWEPSAWGFLFITPLFAIGLRDSFQKKRAILRNFPLLGHARYLFEKIRPEMHQYFIESDTDGTPIPREVRSVVYQRAKVQTDTLPFGTQKNVYSEGYEWLSHSLAPQKVDPASLRVKVGGPDCQKPYEASIFNISAMSYGALSKNAILALSSGAKMGSFYHNTGEGGVSPYHIEGGADLVWQIGTGYFGCRDSSGNFSPTLFQRMANHENIKMIEIKLSQGAKPAHGGLLPAAKITPEIVEIRKVKMGEDAASPSAHRTFSNPRGLMTFVRQLRVLSGGKPIGFKLCIGQPHEFVAICKAMIETGIYPDFITVDGGEGGTGAAPMEFSDSVGAPLEDGLTFVHDTLIGFDIRKHIRLIASGKIFTGFNIFSRMALGADICNTARGMMLALGCIQARQCNTNHCPTGVATSNPKLVQGLVPSDKRVRVYNYHRNTVHAFNELLGSMGLTHTSQLSRHHVHRRTASDTVKTYADLFPYSERGSYLQENPKPALQALLDKASAESFSPNRQLLRKAG